MKPKTIAKSKKAKRAKRMNPAVRLLLLIALVYVAGNMIATCVKLQLQIKEKRQELSEVNQKISGQMIVNEQMNNILSGGVDSEYVTKLMRDRGFCMPGERIYENITDE